MSFEFAVPPSSGTRVIINGTWDFSCETGSSAV